MGLILLFAAAVAVVLIAALPTIKAKLSATFSSISGALS